MITFKEYLAEIFDSHYPFTKGMDAKYSTDYHFQTHEGRHFTVTADKANRLGHADIAFADDDGSTGISGRHPHNSHKVFATVKHIIQHHVANNPDIKHIGFTGDNTHNKLYGPIVKKYGGKETVAPHLDFNSGYHTIFKDYTIPVRS